jgi:HEPN pEK499 p136
MTEIRDLVKEFGERTLSNLDFIQRHADQPDVYEITQLWNSLSGLLVLPYERELDAIQASLTEAAGWGWPELSETFPLNDAQSASTDLADQIRKLRNAVSHYNVKFLSERGSISGVKVWNHDRPRGPGKNQRDMPVNWWTEIPIAQLDQLARAIATLYARKLRPAA